MTPTDLQNEGVLPLPRQEAFAAGALVTIEDVTKSFGYKIALNHVDFSVPVGQICGLLGPEWCGQDDSIPSAHGHFESHQRRNPD
jgi:ABC-type branched-subunit amino acid transport system ATPase component